MDTVNANPSFLWAPVTHKWANAQDIDTLKSYFTETFARYFRIFSNTIQYKYLYINIKYSCILNLLSVIMHIVGLPWRN